MKFRANSLIETIMSVIIISIVVGIATLMIGVIYKDEEGIKWHTKQSSNDSLKYSLMKQIDSLGIEGIEQNNSISITKSTEYEDIYTITKNKTDSTFKLYYFEELY